MIVRFDTATLSSPGGREHNEDSTGFRIVQTGTHTTGKGCWVLADGLGGHRGGAVASSLAVNAALSAFEAAPAVTQESLAGLVGAAHQAVLDRQQSEPDLSHMRTTLVALIASGQEARWAHAGDSRLYWLSAGVIQAQTADHSVPQRLADAGEIRPEEIRQHEDRSRLLRSLGAKPEPGATLRPEPAPVASGDAFLLCSDGFWEWVTEPEMEEDFAAAGSPEQWLGKMEQRLRARATPGHDNYSAIAVFAGANLDEPAAPEKVV